MITKNRPFRRIIAVLMTVAMCLGLAVTVPITWPVKAAGTGISSNLSLDEALLEVKDIYGNKIGDASFDKNEVYIIDLKNNQNVFGDVDIDELISEFPNLLHGGVDFSGTNITRVFSSSGTNSAFITSNVNVSNTFVNNVKKFEYTGNTVTFRESGGDLNVATLLDEIKIYNPGTGLNEPIPAGMLDIGAGTVTINGNPLTVTAGIINKNDIIAYNMGVTHTVALSFPVVDSTSVTLAEDIKFEVKKSGYKLEPVVPGKDYVFEGGPSIEFIFTKYDEDGVIDKITDDSDYVFVISVPATPRLKVAGVTLESDGTLKIEVAADQPGSASGHLQAFKDGALSTVLVQASVHKVYNADLNGPLQFREYNNGTLGAIIPGSNEEINIWSGTSIASVDVNKITGNVYTDQTIFLLLDGNNYIPDRYRRQVEDKIVIASGCDITYELVSVPMSSGAGLTDKDNALGIIIRAGTTVDTYTMTGPGTEPIKVGLLNSDNTLIEGWMNIKVWGNTPNGYMVYQVPNIYESKTKAEIEELIRDGEPDIVMVAHWMVDKADGDKLKKVSGVDAKIIENTEIFLVVTAYYQGDAQNPGSNFIVPDDAIVGWYGTPDDPSEMFGSTRHKVNDTSIYGVIDTSVGFSNNKVLKLDTDGYEETLDPEIGGVIILALSNNVDTNIEIPIVKIKREIVAYIIAPYDYIPNPANGNNVLKDLNDETADFASTGTIGPLYKLNVLCEDEIEIGGFNPYKVYAVYNNDTTDGNFLPIDSFAGSGIELNPDNGTVTVGGWYWSWVLFNNSFVISATSDGGPDDEKAGTKVDMKYSDGVIASETITLTLTSSRVTGLYLVFEDYYGNYFSPDAAMYDNYDINKLDFNFEIPYGSIAKVYGVYKFSNRQFYNDNATTGIDWTDYIADPADFSVKATDFPDSFPNTFDRLNSTAGADYYNLEGVWMSDDSSIYLEFNNTTITSVTVGSAPGKTYSVLPLARSTDQRIKVIARLITHVDNPGTEVDGSGSVHGTALTRKVGDTITTDPYVWISNPSSGPNMAYQLSGIIGNSSYEHIGVVNMVAEPNAPTVHAVIDGYDLKLVKDIAGNLKVTYEYTVTLNGETITTALPVHPQAIPNDYYFEISIAPPVVEKVYLVVTNNDNLTWHQADKKYTLPYVPASTFRVYPVALDSSMYISDAYLNGDFNPTSVDYITPGDVAAYNFLNYMHEDDFDFSDPDIWWATGSVIPASVNLIYSDFDISTGYYYFEFEVQNIIDRNNPLIAIIDADKIDLVSGSVKYSDYTADNKPEAKVHNMPLAGTLNVNDIVATEKTTKPYKVGDSIGFYIEYQVADSGNYLVPATYFDIPGVLTVLPGSGTLYNADAANALRMVQISGGNCTYSYDPVSDQIIFAPETVGIYEFRIWTVNASGTRAPNTNVNNGYRTITFEVEPTTGIQTIYYGKTDPINILSGFTYDSIKESGDTLDAKHLDHDALADGFLKMLNNADATTIVEIYDAANILLARVTVTCVGMEVIDANLSVTTGFMTPREMEDGDTILLYWIVECEPNDGTSNYFINENIEQWTKISSTAGTLTKDKNKVTAAGSAGESITYRATYDDPTLLAPIGETFYARINPNAYYSYVISTSNATPYDSSKKIDEIELEVGEDVTLYLWDLTNPNSPVLVGSTLTVLSDNYYATGNNISGDGAFNIEAQAEGEAKVTVSTSNGNFAEITVKVNPKPIEPKYSISGYVVDDDTGDGIIGAAISITDGTITYIGTTNASGEFTVTGIPNGIYTITASKSGYDSDTTTRTVNNSNIGQIVLTLTLLPNPPGEYELTFDLNGGTTTTTDFDPQYLEAGSITLPSGEPTPPDGYRFTGWLYDGDLYAAGDTFIMPANNVELVAQYQLIQTVPTYTVTYNTGTTDVTVIPPVDPNDYEAGEEVTVLSDDGMERIGYEFVRWEDYHGDPYDPDDNFDMPNHNVTLTAIWREIPTYEVTFDGNGGGWEETDGSIRTTQTRTVNENTAVGADMPEAPERDGYRFEGWNMVDGAPFTATTTVEEDITVYAQWTRVYTVTYELDGGSKPAVEAADYYDPKEYAENETVTVLKAPVRVGYEFVHWENYHGDIYDPDDDFDMPDHDVTLTAVWREADVPVKNYKVTYRNTAMGVLGTAPIDGNSPYAAGSTVTVLGNVTNMSRAGYAFSGWLYNGTVYNAGDTFEMPASNVTLTAQWTKIIVPEPNKVQVVFYWNNGSGTVYASRYVAAGTSLGADMPNNPNPGLMIGSAFAGWNTAANGTGSVFTAGTVVYENTAVYAQWVEKPSMGIPMIPIMPIVPILEPCEVRFEAGSNGSMNPSSYSVNVASGGNVSVVPVITAQSGYVFAGWSMNGGSVYYSSAEVKKLMITVDTIFTAQYTQR